MYDYLKNNKDFKLVQVKNVEGKIIPKIEAYGKMWPYTSRLNIELQAYRNNLNGNGVKHMYNAAMILWPTQKDTWHYWSQKRFEAHVAGYNTITLAGGASCAKSYDAARIAILFWLANPTERTVLVASTSLGDLESRI